MTSLTRKGRPDDQNAVLDYVAELVCGGRRVAYVGGKAELTVTNWLGRASHLGQHLRQQLS